MPISASVLEILNPVLGGLVFALAGFFAARFAYGGRLELLNKQLHNAEQQIADQQQQLVDASAAQTELVRVGEQLKQAQARQQELQQAIGEGQAQIEQLQQRLADLGSELSKSEEAREHEQRSVKQQVEQFEKTREQLKLEFEQLANKIFTDKQQQFTTQNQQGVEALLKPFGEQIKSFREKVEQVYVEEGKERASLKTELAALHKLNQQITEEASNLTRALKGDKKLQGGWGEIQVEMILEQSGLRRDIEYRREQNFKDDNNQNKRVDFIVDLPDNKHLIIDSKVSLVDYTDYVAADDEATQAAALKAHVAAVRNHINSLSSKEYTQVKGVDSPDFVIMFMPIEPAFNLAFLADQGLFSAAFEQNIVVTTPTTLLATLRTVANLWSIERRNQSAQQIAGHAGKVYDKLRGVVEKMERLGSQLDTAKKSYDEAWNSLKQGKGNLIAQTEKFRELGVRVKKELPRYLVEEADPAHDLDGPALAEPEKSLPDAD